MTCAAGFEAGGWLGRRVGRPLQPPSEGMAGMVVLQRETSFNDAPEFSGAGASGRNRGPAYRWRALSARTRVVLLPAASPASCGSLTRPHLLGYRVRGHSHTSRPQYSTWQTARSRTV